MATQRHPRGRVARIAGAIGLLITVIALQSARSDEPVDASAPNPGACAGNPSFCGITLRIDSDAGTIPSVAAGAHYGPAWGIPTTKNNSTGVGWCVDDTHTGFPVGPISERALPTSWTADEMRRAATIITLYGGDKVVPYQPLRIDRAGELAGIATAGISATRHRQIAVWFALRSLLPDGARTPRIDLESAVTFSDPGGRRRSAIGDSAVQLARRLVAVAGDMTASGRPTVTVESTDGQPPATIGAAEEVTVHVQDRAGNPLPNFPVWPSSSTNANVESASNRAVRRSVAFLNAQDAGWPALGGSRRLEGASMTDASGNATFTIEVTEPGTWSVGFETSAAPSRLHLYGDGINAQNNVSTLTADIRSASGSLSGEVVERFVRAVKTTTDSTFGVDGAVFSLIDANGTEVTRRTTDDQGVVDFPPIAAHHPTPLTIREITAPVGLALRPDAVEVIADGGLSTDPDAPTVVEIENRPVEHDVTIQKKVVGSPGFGPQLAGFTFTVTRDSDGTNFGTLTTDDTGRASSLAVPAGDYSIREVDRPERWPGDEPFPEPIRVAVPVDTTEPLVVSFENTLPPPTIRTTATDRADGDKYLSAAGGVIVDAVEVCGVVEGTTYRVEGELMFVDSDSGTVEPTDIHATAEFVAAPGDDGCQAFELDFNVPVDSEWLDRSGHFVVAEDLFVGDDRVATHHDMESIEQSVFVPTVRSLAVDGADGDGWIDLGGGTVVETLWLSDLDVSRPDVELRADSVLMTLDAAGEPTATSASASSTFAVEDVGGGTQPSVEIPYTSADLSDEGGTAVVFTTITDADTGLVIAEHHDPQDTDQQVRWRPAPTELPPAEPPTTEPPHVSAPPSIPPDDLPRTGGGSAVPIQRWGSGLALLGSLLFFASGTRRRDDPHRPAP